MKFIPNKRLFGKIVKYCDIEGKYRLTQIEENKIFKKLKKCVYSIININSSIINKKHLYNDIKF
jgi:hypothetical protein